MVSVGAAASVARRACEDIWRALASPVAEVPRAIARADETIRGVSPFTRLVGLTRSLLAAATLLTIVFTPRNQLFFRSVNYPEGVTCDRILSQASLFCMVPGNQLWLAILIAVAVLMVVLSGFLPAVTAVPHWWVAWSLNITSPIPDGGDQVTSVLTLVLVPLLICDRRRNHWQQDRGYSGRPAYVKVVAYTSLILCWVQVFVIYFHAAIGKFVVEEWANGTVLWYWFQDPTFAPSEPIRSIMLWMVSSSFGAAMLTYGALFIELLLAFALFAGRTFRFVMILVGFSFHLAIAICFGLWSFSVAMAAALLIYLVRARLLTREYQSEELNIDEDHQRPSSDRENGGERIAHNSISTF